MPIAAEDSPYHPTEATFIFENLKVPEKFMISLIGKKHLNGNGI